MKESHFHGFAFGGDRTGQDENRLVRAVHLAALTELEYLGVQVPGNLFIPASPSQAAPPGYSEETGLNTDNHPLTDWHLQNEYEIFEEWRWRYAPSVTHNTEHVFGLCLPEPTPIQIAAREHLGYIWTPWQEAAEKVFSSSNAQAIQKLP